MVRTLPWLKGQRAETQVEGNIQRPTKRQRGGNEVSEVPATPLRRKTATPRGMVSSTCSPLPPLTRMQFELHQLLRLHNHPKKSTSFSLFKTPLHGDMSSRFMREGLEDDDKYIMVEDEFHAIAKSFTQHLHHAEYVRLKQLAKSQNAPKINTISRPVDPQAEMREDTKRMKAQETKSTLQKNALRDMWPAERAADKSGLEDQANPDEGHWAGTSLQGLMASPRRVERSLTAVSGIKSTTRAAAGFTKAANVGAPISRLTHSVKREPTSESALARFPIQVDATTSEDDGDDDLDAPVYVKVEDNAHHVVNTGDCDRNSRLRHREGIPINQSPPQKLKTDNSGGNGLEAQSHTSYSSGSSKVANDFLPRPTALPGEASQLRSKRIAKFKAETADTDKKDGKFSSIFDEIPTFLV